MKSSATPSPHGTPPGAHVESVDPSEVSGGVVWDSYVDRPPTKGQRLGICCSGGGIRSASFNLGALQVLRETGELDRARYLSSVSGGGYIAIAHAITAWKTDASVLGALPPWAPGSPEERRLRNNSTYLAPGTAGKLWLLLNVVLNLAVNLLPFLAGAWVAGRVTGWVLAGLHPGLRAADPPTDPTVAVTGGWYTVAAIAAVAGLCLVGRRLVEHLRRPPQWVVEKLEQLAPRLLQLAVVALVALVALPHLVAWLLDWGGRITDSGDVETLQDAAPGNLPGANVPAVIALLGALPVAGIATLLARRALPRLVRLLASVAGPVILAAPFLLAATGAASTGAPADAEAEWVPRILVGLAIWGVIGHNVRWSMHLFYKQRLSTVFAVKRVEKDGVLRAEPLPWAESILFSELDVPGPGKPGHVPELVVCAAANVKGPVPPGRAAASFVFTKEECGGPVTGCVPTQALEAAAGAGVLTLPAAMAISGAAISPSMGKMTRGWLTFVMALFNVRLGVWLPNPLKVVERHCAEVERQDARLAVGAGDPPERGWVTRTLARVVRGWKQPGPLYVLYEALGRNDLRRDYLCVTDGGHWENLGLVELLRRGCTEILCFDAAGDKLDTFNTLGEAIALARSELGVEITIDPESAGLLPGDRGYSLTDNVVGEVRYPDGTEGVLVFAKAAMAKRSPWDAKAYRRRDRRFPAHGTGDQLFDDAQFSGYHGLGAATARHAVHRLSTERARRTSASSEGEGS